MYFQTVKRLFKEDAIASHNGVYYNPSMQEGKKYLKFKEPELHSEPLP